MALSETGMHFARPCAAELICSRKISEDADEQASHRSGRHQSPNQYVAGGMAGARRPRRGLSPGRALRLGDRKSTRLNSSHGYISYAVFCLKKKKKTKK